MALYLSAGLLLFLSHALLSAPQVRPRLVACLGLRGFGLLHGLVSLAALLLFLWAGRRFVGVPQLWWPPDWAAPLAVALMPLAFLLLVARLARPFGEIVRPHPPRGIYRVTRAPGSLALLLWSGLHLFATGDARRVILFGVFAAMALFALIKNEFWLAQQVSPEARRFRAETSLLPFAAMLAGRQAPQPKELQARIPVIGLFAYLAFLKVHPLLFGVDPLGWLP